MNRNLKNAKVGTLSQLLEYFDEHREIFQKQTNKKSHMERVMAVLNQDNMEHLEKQFQLYSKGLQLPTFIYLMKNLYIPDNQLTKYFFVSDLIKFFQAIDINGDGHLEWSQFTEYIIQNIRVVEKPKYKNIIYEQNEIISSAYSRISNEYRIKKVWDLNNSNIIKKIIYTHSGYSAKASYRPQKPGFYYALQNCSNIIKIYDGMLRNIDTIELQPSINKSYITDFSLDKKNSIMGILFEDYIYFINLKVKAATKSISKYDELLRKAKNFNKIQYLEQHDFWFVSTKHGDIFLLTITYQSRIQLNAKIVDTLKYHQETITSVLQMQSPSKLIVTSSLDGAVIMYSFQIHQTVSFEIISEQKKSIINQKNIKGIQGIDGCCEFGNYIITYTFNNYVYIYSLDMSISKGYVNKYAEHSGNIMMAKFLKGYPYVLSFDEKLNMRIWDFRKLNTIQLLNCQKIFINPFSLSFTLIPEKSEILISEKKITQFSAPLLQQKSKQINQFHDIFDLKYCPFTNSIFLFTSIDVRIYSYYTGSLQKLFTKLYENNYQTNITAAEFGYKNKRFFVGDAAGYVRQFCSETGDLLQKISPDEQESGDESTCQNINKYENKEIIKIIFLKDHSLLVCCSIDGRLMIYERNQQSQFEIVRDFRECHDEVKCATACNRYCLLATGGQDGVVNLWNLQKYCLQSMCVMSSKIIGIAFSPIHPIMIVCTQDGYLNFIGIRPCENWKLKNKCFTKIKVLTEQSMFGQKVTSFSFELILKNYLPQNSPLIWDNFQGEDSQIKKNRYKNSKYFQNETLHYLIAAVGTSRGKILLINLNRILDIFQVQENHLIFTIKSCQRSQIQNFKGHLINEKNRILLNGYTNHNKDIIEYGYQSFCHVLINVNSEKKTNGKDIQQVKNLSLSKQNAAVMMRGTDKKFRLFSMVRQNQKNTEKNKFKYRCTGIINFSTFKKQFWLLPQINLFKKLQSIDTTLYSIKLIQSKKFEAQEQQKIKVCLLLNQIIPSTRQKQQYYQWIKMKHLKQLKTEESQSVQGITNSHKRKQKQAITSKNKDNLNQIQFNQIYTKLITSINKSLGEDYIKNHKLQAAKKKQSNSTTQTLIKNKKCQISRKQKSQLYKKVSLQGTQNPADSNTFRKDKYSNTTTTPLKETSKKIQTSRFIADNRSYIYSRLDQTNCKDKGNKLKSTLDSFFSPLRSRQEKQEKTVKRMSENKQKNLLFTPLKLAQKKISYNMGYSTKMLR